MKAKKRMAFLASAILIIQGLMTQQNSVFAVQLSQKTQMGVRLQTTQKTEALTGVEAEAEASAQVEATYKSDALDELLEDNLFKKKKAALPNNEESLLDQALYAKVDEKALLGEKEQQVQNLPTQLTPQPQATGADGLTYSQMQQAKDAQLIQLHLQNFQSGQKEMGSNILYSTLMNDLDVSSPDIPAFTPPGMPDTGTNNQLYGTELAPASPWALGVSQGSQALSSPAVSQATPSVDLNDQSLTQISAEAYMRGSTKYDEQAEQLINEDEQKQKNSLANQIAVSQQRQSQQEESEQMEDLIGSALSSMKTTNKKTVNVEQSIQLQNDLEYVAAFGV